MKNQIFQKRRTLLTCCAFSSLSGFDKLALAQQTQPLRPNPASFESGDLIWPKYAGQLIPYSGNSKQSSVIQAEELSEDWWSVEKIRYIKDARRPRPDLTPAKYGYLNRVADQLEDLTYSRFIHKYSAEATPETFQAYGLGKLLYVGHVGIIDVDAKEQKAYVVEAVYGKTINCVSCVQRVPYDDWLKERGDILVWHGRLKNFSSNDRSRIASMAAEQVTKPYRFFNFDLLDDSGFYCSKLAWNSIWKALGIPVDGDKNPERLLWLSPLQTMKSKSLELLVSPGNYQNV